MRVNKQRRRRVDLFAAKISLNLQTKLDTNYDAESFQQTA
ncbi:unnamed protein product [Paramecium pentaurelia]|uniref:Uncharacterized protein n=1 Tax=Paramecium pentaurelia TaxID=43138 RepID=A0A8S1Y552_9CILI|nr:unnamed protein product [Paramecium pentaurelia]